LSEKKEKKKKINAKIQQKDKNKKIDILSSQQYRDTECVGIKEYVV
jgi:hypothetical protein